MVSCEGLYFRWSCRLPYDTDHNCWLSLDLTLITFSHFGCLLLNCCCLLWIDEAKSNIKPIHECRCNERLQTKRFTCLSHTGLVVVLEHLKIKTRLTIKKLMFIRKAAALTRARPTLLCSCVRKAARRKVNWPPGCVYARWTPEVAKKRSVSRWAWPVVVVTTILPYFVSNCIIKWLI